MSKIDLKAHLSTFLGPVDHRTPVSELRARLHQRGEFLSRRLLSEATDSFRTGDALVNEPSRVLLARVLVAQVPDSLSVISSSLQTTGLSEEVAEFQFSIFVALSELPPLSAEAETLNLLTRLLKEYLLAIDSNIAQAAWMAGDLLGDHWPLELSLPVLTDVARNAQYPAGRDGAIHGLSHALARAGKAEQWKIVELLKHIAKSDDEPSVRTSAEMAMGSLRAR